MSLQSRLSLLVSAIGADIKAMRPGVTPVGGVLMWPSYTPPQNWLNCDGSAISRSTYATLFALMGTTYGTGDGINTFNLPDLRSKFPVGSQEVSGIAKMGESVGSSTHQHALPVHTHALNDSGWAEIYMTAAAIAARIVTGLPSFTATIRGTLGSGNSPASYTAATALSGNTGNNDPNSSDSQSNIPPAVGINFIIRAL